MRQQIALLIILALESLAINDKNDAAYCKSKGLDNCVRCPDMDNTDFGTLTVMCYQCADGYLWDQAHAAKCVAIPEKRTIAGWGRDCAECGNGNAWSTANTNCIACRYEASKCASSPCCTPDTDLNCNKNFELVGGKCICKRGDNFKINGDCYCLEDLTYVAYENDAIVCKKCEDKCPIGCADFTCPDGTYLDKNNADPDEQCKCKPVHYSCATGTGPLETDCTTCNTDDGFSFVKLGDKSYCYCSCCLIEADESCVKIGPQSAYDTCQGTSISQDTDCPDGFLKVDGECVQIVMLCNIGEELVNGECVPKQCDYGFELVDGECVPISCDYGYELVNGECAPIICGDGYNFVNGQCIQIQCNYGIVMDGNCYLIDCGLGLGYVNWECQPMDCIIGFVFSVDRCVDASGLCSYGFIYNNGVCECMPGTVLDEETGECII